jgi:hypothetical protein
MKEVKDPQPDYLTITPPSKSFNPPAYIRVFKLLLDTNEDYRIALARIPAKITSTIRQFASWTLQSIITKETYEGWRAAHRERIIKKAEVSRKQAIKRKQKEEKEKEAANDNEGNNSQRSCEHIDPGNHLEIADDYGGVSATPSISINNILPADLPRAAKPSHFPSILTDDQHRIQQGCYEVDEIIRPKKKRAKRTVSTPTTISHFLSKQLQYDEGEESLKILTNTGWETAQELDMTTTQKKVEFGSLEGRTFVDTEEDKDLFLGLRDTPEVTDDLFFSLLRHSETNIAKRISYIKGLYQT